MDEAHLYDQIAKTIRQQILDGAIQPGDRLPSVRDMMGQWNCSPGTVQRAYQDLVASGLAESRPGKGTFVVGGPSMAQSGSLRRAELVHRAEAFLLEALTTGHTPEEIDQAFRIALDRWRAVKPGAADESPPEIIRFSGSHDPAVAWLAGHFAEVDPAYQLQPQFTGSLGGLIALAEGKCDLAGCHLLDQESDTYNIPFVRRLLPGQKLALVLLANRRLGLILQPGNPLYIRSLGELPNPKVKFINRQPGSGTRVWLDVQLRRLGIDPDSINGYRLEVQSHSAVAQAVAEGIANCGFGLESSALAYRLDFQFLTTEEYHLVIPLPQLDRLVVKAFLEWLASPAVKEAISGLGGYDTDNTGEMMVIST